METNQIKKFAIEARNILKTGVLNKITSLGFDAHGKVEEKNKPLKVQPGAIYNRQIKKFPTEKQNVSLKHILT